MHRRRARALLPPQALHFQVPDVTSAFAAGSAVFDAAKFPDRVRMSRTGRPDTPMLNVLLELVAFDGGASVAAAIADAFSVRAVAGALVTPVS